MAVEWVFDPAPPSGKRTGGNAAEYSFEGQIDILVREVVQNSLDAAIDDETPVDVTFRLIDLEGDYLDAFRESMGWSTLEDNLRAVPRGRGGKAITRAIDQMQSDQKLRLLIIEDRGTRGLEGDERRKSDDEKNSFCALVRDELYSDKLAADAGGSFGLGKSVLWAYSSLKTVLFASSPYQRPEGKVGLRFIGRTSLPYHQSEADGACTGDGWFGVAREAEKSSGRHAESVWSEEATRLAVDCFCRRDPRDCGLSTVIVGFAEPGEEDRDSTHVIGSIVEKSLESFWPAIVRDSLRVTVRREQNEEVIETKSVDPSGHPAFRHAAELLRSFDAGELEEAESALDVGDSAMTWATLQLPQRLEDPSHGELDVRVPVLVRVLKESDEIEPVRDRVFRFRRPGLVVRSGGGSNLSIAARPYIAAVLAGRAAGEEVEHEHMERFLRCAEPPAHDEWSHNTRSLKEQYKVWGCKKKLQEFDRRVLEAIRRLVSQPEEKGGELPRHLLRHLRFGDRSGGGRPRFLSVTRQKAEVTGGSWSFQARCRRVKPDDQPWHVTVHLKYAMDGGRGGDVHAIGSVEASEASRREIRKGVAFLEFPPDVSSTVIRGAADPAALPAVGTRAAVRLRIDGCKGEIPDA